MNSCRQCGAWHFSFLCTQSKFSPKASPVKRLSVSSLILNRQTNYVSRINDSMLPTFTCKLLNRTLRGMKDSGSQSNLIDERLLTPPNHEILEAVELDLSGINASKLYRTKLVEIELKIGDSFRTIEAIAMPSLNINLTLPGLSQIVRGFVEKGYEIADQKLLQFRDYIVDIDFLLGTEVSYCFLEEMVPFGPDNKSTFSLSNLGVMFHGKTEQTLRISR